MAETINNGTWRTQVSGSSKDDYIINSGSYVTIKAGNGDDTILNYTSNVSIDAGTGNDYVENYEDDVTVNGNDGNDVIYNEAGGWGDKVLGGKGDDSIYSYWRTTLDAGEGDDTIIARAGSILAGAGNDFVRVEGRWLNYTLDGGKGDDYFQTADSESGGIHYGRLYLYKAGDGKDTITDAESIDTIQIYDGSSYTTQKSGNDLLINVLEGSVRILNVFSGSDSDTKMPTVFSAPIGEYARYLVNNNETSLVSGMSLNDTIINYGAGSTLVGGKGDDQIRNDAASSYLLGGEGNDTLYNKGSNSIVEGGAGADSIVGSSLGSGISYDGGAGDDRLEIQSAESTVIGGEGADYITSSGKNNVINGGAGDDQINSSGANAVITGDAGDDQIQIESTGTKSNVDAGAGNDLINNFAANSTLLGGSGKDTINNYASGAAIGGNAGDDYLYNTAANVSLDGGEGNDTIVNSGETAKKATIHGGAGDDFIAIGSTVQGNVITYSDGDGNDTIQNFGKNDVLKFDNNLTVTHGRDGADYVINVTGNSGTSQIVLQGLGDYEFDYSDGQFKVTEMTPVPGPDDNVWFATIANYSDNNVYINPATNDPDYDDDYPTNYYIVNETEYVTIKSGGNDDSIEGSEAYGEVFIFDALSGKDVFTNFNDADTIAIDTSFGKVTSSYAMGDDYVIRVGDDASLVLSGAASLAGMIKWSNVTNDGTKYQYLTIDGVSKITNRADKTKVDGTYKRDYIINTGMNATINGKGGNDTIVGSANGEVFQFAADGGNDLITNFGKNDTLQITSGTVQSMVVSGNDVIVNVKSGTYSGTITLGGAADYKFITGKNGVYTVENLNYMVNREDSVKVTGKSGKDYITNSGNNVTIQAGKGDDTIEGSEFGEVFNFAYNYGNNVITNFGKNDSLNITSGTATTQKSGDDVIMSITKSGTTAKVTLKGAAAYSLVKDGKIWSVDVPNEISEEKDKIKIEGTGGKDYIESTGEGVTIQAGAGNDTIVGSDVYGDLFLFAPTDGNNVIKNFGKGDTIMPASGNIAGWDKNADGDWVVTIASGSKKSTIVLQNESGTRDDYELIESVVSARNGVGASSVLIASFVTTIVSNKDGETINGTSGRDYIINNNEKSVIKPGTGDDTMEGSTFAEIYQVAPTGGNDVITNFAQKDTLQATSGTLTYEPEGKDVIVTIASGSNAATVLLQDVTVDKLKQNGRKLVYSYVDTIENDNDGEKIKGTSEDDVIINTGDKVTIEAAAGNDTIYGSEVYGERFQFASSHGNDVIYNFGLRDTLNITSGTISGMSTVGNDVIVSVGSGTVTLKDVADSSAFTLKMSSNKKNITAKTTDIVKINDKDNKKFNGDDDANYLINTGQYVTVEGKGGNDTIEGNDEYGEVFVFNGIDGDDVITNFGAGDTLKINSGTIQSAIASGSDFVITVKQEGETGTVTFKDVDATKIMQKNDMFVYDAPSKIVNRTDTVKVNGTALSDTIINTGNKVTINGGAGNDTITGSAYGELFQFAADGGQDLITNFGKNDTLQVIGGAMQTAVRSGNDVIVNVKSGVYSGTITLGGAAAYEFESSSDSIKGGAFLTVVSKNYVVNRDDNTLVSGSSGKDYITNSGQNVTISSGKGNDTIEGSEFGEVFNFAYNYGNNIITNFGVNDSLNITSGTAKTSVKGDDVIVTITKGSTSSKVTLKGAAGYTFEQEGSILSVEKVNPIDNADDNVKISGTSSADYIVNTGEHVTIQANGGADTITGSDQYGDLFLFAATDGKNVITNFGKDDSLKVTNGTTMSYKKSGDNVVVTIKGTKTAYVTLEGAANLDLDFSLNKTDSILTASGVNTIINGYDDIKVTGTSGRDYIINSGQSTSVVAGKGKDTIEGSVFSEKFLFAYTYGDNVITNFGVNDTLVATSGTISTKKSGDDMIVSITKSGKSATVTLQGAGDYDFEMNSKKTNLYVPGINYISNDKDKVKVSGTSNRDYVVNTGDNVTLVGSKGNDTFTGSDQYSETYRFGYAHGDNVILNFGNGDKISTTSGTISTQKSGSDYIVSITRGSTTSYTTLVGAADEGILQKSTDSKSYILRTNTIIILSEAPSSAEDYWFTEDETASADVGEVDELLSEAADTSLGKLTLNNEADELLTDIESKFEQKLAVSALDQKKKQK